MAEKKSNRCWPGYEPVNGKPKNTQGSCRPKAESKLTASEKQFRAKRKKQLADWKAKHPGSPKKAAQHLSKPGAKRKTK
jgi:hypothetical protein